MPGGHRRWCFTVHPEDGGEAPFLSEIPAGCKYIIWQLEEGHDNHRRHFQGYCVFRQSVSLGAVKRALGSDSAHLEPAHGDEDSCIAYCSKEDTRVLGPWSFGERSPGQGKRSDLDDLVQRVKNNEDDHQIAEAEPVAYARYANHIRNLRGALFVPKMRPGLKTLVLWGSTGTGKSYWAWNNCPSLYRVNWKSDGHIWFDGYRGHRTLLFDDFYGQVPLERMLHYLDIYPLTVEVKGSTVVACWTEVIITSNAPPAMWYMSSQGTFGHCQEKIEALNRRLTEVVEVRRMGDLDNLVPPWGAPPPSPGAPPQP
ncbi:Rep [uncultured virus]|uniref:ATP-dependent helicase Rep n=1 Tax=uncultured virus TaxID=340016 RepID=A0A2K9LSG2_9VIRU|nr:Rep [uncultured virus]